MPERYWLVHPNGGRQLIDPRQFDLGQLSEQARRFGGRLVIETRSPTTAAEPFGKPFEPPIAALRPVVPGSA